MLYNQLYNKSQQIKSLQQIHNKLYDASPYHIEGYNKCTTDRSSGVWALPSNAIWYLSKNREGGDRWWSIAELWERAADCWRL